MPSGDQVNYRVLMPIPGADPKIFPANACLSGALSPGVARYPEPWLSQSLKLGDDPTSPASHTISPSISLHIRLGLEAHDALRLGLGLQLGVLGG